MRRKIIGLILMTSISTAIASLAADNAKAKVQNKRSNAAGQAKDSIKNATDVIGKEAVSAEKALGNTMHDMGNKSTKPGKAMNDIGNSMKNAGQVVGKEVVSAEKALGNTMHDMGDKSTKTGKNVSNIGDSMRSAGNVVGKEMKSAEQALGNSVKKAGQTVDNADEKKTPQHGMVK